MHLDRLTDVGQVSAKAHQLPLFPAPSLARTKYFVAHLLSGEVASYHRTLTRELAERYQVTALHKKVDPHVTIKIPFYANSYEIAQVEEVLHRFSETTEPTPLTFDRFGRFGFKTVYLDVVKSQRAVELVRSCVAELNTLPWMQRIPHEGNKLHASVARFMTYKQFRRVWRHVKTEPAHFKHQFGSIAILKKDASQNMWNVHRTFALALTSPIVAERERDAVTLLPELTFAV